MFSDIFSLYRFRLCFLIIIIYLTKQSSAKAVFLYNETEDHIMQLNRKNFDQTVFNADKASMVEFFAHWCGRCRRWAPYWKDLGKQTVLWQKNIIQIGAVDCALTEHRSLCRLHKVEFFPTFYLYEAYMQKKVGTEANYEHKSDEFANDIIDFLENHSNRPETWPSFEPYEFSLNDVFKDRSNLKYALLIFEPESSYLARKLILDFEIFQQKLLIKRVICKKNKGLCDEFGVDSDATEATFFIITNTRGDVNQFDKFQNVIDSLNRDGKRNTVDFDPDEIVVNEHDPRNNYMKMIKDFIEHTHLTFEEDVEF